MIGLSPAYFISRFTDEFTPSDVAGSLNDISAMGYGGFQLEVYHRRYLKLWLEDGAQRIRQRADDLNLKPTQFVAHFMLAAFANPENLNSDLGLAEMPAVLDIVSHLDILHNHGAAGYIRGSRRYVSRGVQISTAIY